MRKTARSVIILRIGIFNDKALSYLLPGESPTITTEVLELTEDDTLPPRSSIILLASSLVILIKLPVRTKVLFLNSSFSSYSVLFI